MVVGIVSPNPALEERIAKAAVQLKIDVSLSPDIRFGLSLNSRCLFPVSELESSDLVFAQQEFCATDRAIISDGSPRARAFGP